jgi:hypothetical protein
MLAARALAHLDGSRVRVHDDPIAGFDDLQRIPIELGDRRHSHHDGA